MRVEVPLFKFFLSSQFVVQHALHVKMCGATAGELWEEGGVERWEEEEAGGWMGRGCGGPSRTKDLLNIIKPHSLWSRLQRQDDDPRIMVKQYNVKEETVILRADVICIH